MTARSDAARRAARLLRWYPRSWRDRYGEEFAELLIADMEERPRCAGRALDVAFSGLTARLADLGLAGRPLPAMAATAASASACRRQASASLGSIGCALAVFLSFSAAVWSQLIIARQWTPQLGQLLAQSPHAVSATAVLATNVISVAMLALLGLAVIAALPPLVTIAVRIAAPSRTSSGEAEEAGERAARMPLLRPAAVLLAAAALLFIEGRHFGNGWPGTGGHGSFVPAGLAAFLWANSMSVSTYWVHPGVLPAAESHWMLASPVALAAAVIAAAILLRRARLSARVLAFEARMAALACTVMALILVAAAVWVATNGPVRTGDGTAGLFNAGLIDLAATGMLACALAVSIQATRTASRALRRAAS